MKTSSTTPEVSFSFDIGHASIGWAAFRCAQNSVYPEILGTGVMLFPKEDCQNHLRAGFRRQRRHIAATRNRISRIRSLLVSMGVLTEEEASAQAAVSSGVMMPWLYAARALSGTDNGKLNWMELWQVLRWYAHNRGYDGNARWAHEEDSKDDTDKVKKANALMEQFSTKTMAETVCAFIGVNVNDAIPCIPENAPYFKGQSVAFDRKIVRDEVERVVRAQFGHLQGCDEAFLSLLMGRDLTREEKRRFKLPERYAGGLLFGQMIPRFDNRIIPNCRISGEKTPSKHCADYYRFRWAMLVANIFVDDSVCGRRPLSPSERMELTRRMEMVGGMTAKALRDTVEDVTGASAKTLDDQFFSPETEKALVLDPVRDRLRSAVFASVWPLVPEPLQRRLAGVFFKRKSLSLAEILAAMADAGMDTAEMENTIRLDYAKAAKRKRTEPLTYETYLRDRVGLAAASGRAPYSRVLMRKAYEESMAGMHPTSIADSQPQTALERRNGCIAITEGVTERAVQDDLDEHTNNHLVRQRIRMFQRLFKDMYALYAGGDVRRVGDVTVEVARDMQEYAGKNSKEKAAVFSEKAKPFQRAEAKLRKDFEEAGIQMRISYRMIRKARIAMAQNWTCPYTGRRFSAAHIAYDKVDFEHIIPHAQRKSDALEGLAITFREVNAMKGKRSAVDFIRECQGQSISITGENNSEIWTESHFRNFVSDLYPKMRPSRSASDEDKINWRRKVWLLKEDYDERDADFTKGALTITSHLNKLAALEARKFLREEAKAAAGDDGLEVDVLPEHRVGHMQGSITSEFRKGWHLLGCLAPVCPEVIDQADPEKRILPKGEIRNITHLHHALDAISIGLARNIFRNNVVSREVCEAILSRNPNPKQRQILESLGVFGFDSGGRPHLYDLPDDVLDNIESRLGEYRVVQHVPKSMHGLRAEQTQWRVVRTDGDTGRVHLSQYGPRDPKNGNVRHKKEAAENPNRLLGYNPSGDSKLKSRQAVVVISDNFGIALVKEPVVIPFHNVWQRLGDLAALNDGKIPQVLRIGNVIEIPSGRYKGRWKIHSTKANAKGVSVDMAWPHLVKAENKKAGSKINVLLKTIITDGMTILHPSLVG